MTNSATGHRSPKWTSITITLCAGLSLAFVIGGRSVLPEKYSYDEKRIAALAQEIPGTPTDKSFQLAADFYRHIGLGENQVLAGIVTFALFVAVLCLAFRAQERVDFSMVRIGLLVAVLVLGAVYLGHYAKEVLILPIVAIAMIRRSAWWVDLTLVSCMLLCATFFRSYWFMVAAFYLGFRWLLHKLSPALALLVGAAVGLGILSVAFTLLMGVDLDHYRILVNDGRTDGADAQTAIKPLIESAGVVGGYINALAVLFSFFLPLSLVLKGQIFYLVIVAFLLMLWIFLFRALGQLSDKSVRLPQSQVRGIALLFAFTVVQAVFEPDYGSYVRHLAPLLPIMLSAIFYNAPSPWRLEKRENYQKCF
nr:hypothetical protein [Arthrobacter ulcerisalmonis]